VPIVLKYVSLNLLEPSGPFQACNRIPLPFTIGLLTLKILGFESTSCLLLYSKNNNNLGSQRNVRDTAMESVGPTSVPRVHTWSQLLYFLQMTVK
jgi:hypothetical protein